MARHHVTSSGVLRGLGLVPVKRNVSASLQRGVSNMFSMRDLTASLPQNDDGHRCAVHAPTWSVPNDIFAFGLAIYNTRQWVSMHSDEKILALPLECPQFLNEQEWDLVERMCARTPERRVSIMYVVHQLQAFV
ncbi:TKL protein kinase [Phytophthora megakarya]|uniref:TKL protein kinase n=1 Tax=Phytophthora megakarya TaxID=4795 RepID=A0A225UAQ7_9STRA|nr:TKL protein kinase [Phytophthora megakarya]